MQVVHAVFVTPFPLLPLGTFHQPSVCLLALILAAALKGKGVYCLHHQQHGDYIISSHCHACNPESHHPPKDNQGCQRLTGSYHA